jgi:hypothetical protein
MDVHPDRIAHGINPALPSSSVPDETLATHAFGKRKRLSSFRLNLLIGIHHVTLLKKGEVVDDQHNPYGRFRNI